MRLTYMRSFLLVSLFGIAFMGCGDGSNLGEGKECFSSSECATGLLCDFGSTPSVCRPMQTVVDASSAPAVDASNNIDARAGRADARPVPIDAPPVPIDAAVPDAAIPDAAIPDAAVPDAQIAPSL